MRQFYFSVALLFSLALSSRAQVNYTANDPAHVFPYTTEFLFGTNMGAYDTWTNVAVADIAAGNPALNVKGAGAKSLHLPLPENFLDPRGPGHYDYDVELWQFAHFATIGIKDNAVWLEQPLDVPGVVTHRDQTIYPGCNEQSLIWSNIYEPIWDGGANGTAYNDNNYLAAYIYKTVSLYKPYVKFWELVNEPDFDDAGVGFRSPGDQAGNWWDRNPQPCELHNLKAPITSYIRMLHILYEVVKTLDPSAYVSMGGVGYPSFLDAVLRNTENPNGGAVTAQYPTTGGGWIDCLSFHYYPMYDLHKYDISSPNAADWGWRDYRHSDAAIDGYVARKKLLDSVLNNRGYNGITYPKKVFINTENNVSRKQFPVPDGSGSTYIGGDEVQRNFDMKALVASQINDVRQFYIFGIGDSKNDNEASDNPFDFVGLYKNLNGNGPGYDVANPGTYGQQYNQSGIAYKTMSDALMGFSYDKDRTALMNLPAKVRGGAFKNSSGDYKYVLWAATSIDNSEAASATYAFPPSIMLPSTVEQRSWDFSQTNTSPVASPNNIALTGSPSIISAPLVVTALKPGDSATTAPEAYFSFSIYPNPVKDVVNLKLHLKKRAAASIKVMDGMGQVILQVADNTMYNSGDNLVHLTLPSRIAGGIYYCRMISGGNEQTVKFIVSK